MKTSLTLIAMTEEVRRLAPVAQNEISTITLGITIIMRHTISKYGHTVSPDTR
jgi:hypothetical protein